MAISRFDKFLTSDYGMNWYQPQLFTPNFEMLGKQIESVELAKNQFDIMANAQVDYLRDIHDEPAKVVKEKIQQTKDMLSEAVASGDMSKYKSAQRQGIGQLQSLYLPGGDAYLLAEAKKAFNAKLDDINKNVKGDDNRKYAINSLIESTKDAWKNQKSIQVGTPEIIDYQDLVGDAYKLGADLKASDSTDPSKLLQIASQYGIKNVPSDVLIKVQQEGVTKDRLKDLVTGLVNSGKYDGQLKVNNFAKYGYTNQLPQEKKEEFVNKINLNIEEQKKSYFSGLDQLFSTDLANAKTKKEKDLLTNYYVNLKQQKEQDFNNKKLNSTEDLNSFFKNETVDHVYRAVSPLSYTKKDYAVDWNLMKERNDERRHRENLVQQAKNQDAELIPVEIIGNTLDFEKTLSESLTETTNARNNTISFAGKLGLSGTPDEKVNQLFKLRSTFSAARQQGLSGEDLKNFIKQNVLKNYDNLQADKILNQFSQSSGDISAILDNDVKAYKKHKQADENIRRYHGNYAESPAGDKMFEGLYWKYGQQLGVNSASELKEKYLRGDLQNAFVTSMTSGIAKTKDAVASDYKPFSFIVSDMVKKGVEKMSPKELQKIQNQRIVYAYRDENLDKMGKASAELLNDVGDSSLKNPDGVPELTWVDNETGEVVGKITGGKYTNKIFTTEGAYVVKEVGEGQNKKTYRAAIQYNPAELNYINRKNNTTIANAMNNNNPSTIYAGVRSSLYNNTNINESDYNIARVNPASNLDENYSLTIQGIEQKVPVMIDNNSSTTVDVNGQKRLWQVIKLPSGKYGIGEVNQDNKKINLIPVEFSKTPFKTDQKLFNNYETARAALHFADKYLKGDFEEQSINK